MRSKKEICRDLELWKKSSKYTQDYISKQIDITQAHLSKILDPAYKGYSKSFLKLCNYANIDVRDSQNYDPLNDEELRLSIKNAIGNDASKARFVSTLMQALGSVKWESL